MILEEIVRHRREDVARDRVQTPESVLRHSAIYGEPRRGFLAALRKPGRHVIAEVKKASPSKGLIRADFDPVAIAREYAAGGASAISVLTEERYFQGRGEYLTRIRAEVAVPLLRKDFVFDPYQITEARALGADAVLLILAMLDEPLFRDLQAVAKETGLDSLVEVHDEGELERALAAGAPLVGVNNRNLRTFETTLATSEALAPLIPKDRLMVGESGIFAPADLARLARVGMSTFLVGESLMRQADVAAATRALLSRGDSPRATGTR